MYWLTVLFMVHGHPASREILVRDLRFPSVQACASFVVRNTPRNRRAHGVYACRDGNPYDTLTIPF